MINEGIIINDTKSLVKSEMLRQLWEQKRTTPDSWQRAVLESLSGGRWEDIDWTVEDNQAGAYTWIRSFDQLVTELVEDGYVAVEETEGGKVLVPTDPDPGIEYSHAVYPPR